MTEEKWAEGLERYMEFLSTKEWISFEDFLDECSIAKKELKDLLKKAIELGFVETKKVGGKTVLRGTKKIDRFLKLPDE